MTYRTFKVRKVYHYRFQVKPFPRVQRSTRETDKKRADVIARRAYDAAVARSNGGQPIPTLAQLAADWLLVHGPAVGSAHRTSVDVFVRRHLYGLGDVHVDQLDTLRVETARNQHLTTHLPSSVNHWLRILKLIIRWGVKRNILPALPWDVPMIKLQKKPRKTLPKATTADWLAAVTAVTHRDPGVALCVRMMYGMGLRESEAGGARWEWLDWARGTYTPGETKGKEAVPLDVPDWLMANMAPLRKDEGLMAPRIYGPRKGQCRPKNFSHTAIRKANLICRTPGITPHRLRGTFATVLMESGAPLHEVQETMRHKMPLTTMGYLEKRRGNVKKAQERMAHETGLARRESGDDRPASPHE